MEMLKRTERNLEEIAWEKHIKELMAKPEWKLTKGEKLDLEIAESEAEEDLRYEMTLQNITEVFKDTDLEDLLNNAITGNIDNSKIVKSILDLIGKEEGFRNLSMMTLWVG